MSATEFKTPLAEVTLFVVTTPEEGKALMESGVPRGRILSPKEIEALSKLRGIGGERPSVEELRAVLEAKLTFDARVQDVITVEAK
jgi:hypothetical protein